MPKYFNSGTFFLYGETYLEHLKEHQIKLLFSVNQLKKKEKKITLFQEPCRIKKLLLKNKTSSFECVCFFVFLLKFYYI